MACRRSQRKGSRASSARGGRKGVDKASEDVYTYVGGKTMSRRRATEAVLELGCGCATLRRAARAVTAVYDEKLKPCGLRVTQFTLLEALERAGEIAQGQLGEILGIDSTTLTRSLALL